MMDRKIITHNVRRAPGKHSGMLMSVMAKNASTLNIYIPKDICERFPKFDGRSKFHIAEGLDEDCLFLIPHEDGLTANKTSIGKQIIHLNLGYLENYKVVWPEKDINTIRATQVSHEILNGEIKVACPKWLKRVG